MDLSPQSTEPTGSDPLSFAFASRDADILELVRSALAAGRAQLAYQPAVIAGTPKRIAFHETLIRVSDECGRVIPAAHFMPIIEETDLGRQIDAASLELAMKMLKHQPRVRLSVNVSARSLADWDWRRQLELGLASGISLRDHLIFEISETSAMQLHEVVIRFMEEMHPKGLSFALDGFGGGQTSFRHLRDFFFDFAKIDKSFVKDVHQDPNNQVLVEALITVAHQFEMFAVADGVEAAEDARFLQATGIDCMQGFHFGVPKPSF
ncbi:EAL domain-containing protein [Cognatiyoonia sediminum]|nr:EAL domain-containing protein [Cognatiyoonia sediminum]